MVIEMQRVIPRAWKEKSVKQLIGCSICGYNESKYALEGHHIHGKQHSDIMLCANCRTRLTLEPGFEEIAFGWKAVSRTVIYDGETNQVKAIVLRDSEHRIQLTVKPNSALGIL